MRRTMLRWVSAMMLCAGLPTLAAAQAAVEIETSQPAKLKHSRVAVVTPEVCPYRAASPYNAIYVNRPLPNAALNRPNYVLCCEIPNLNPAPYVAPPCGCGDWFNRCNDNCDHGCGSLFGRIDFGRGCQSNCDSCDRGFRGWQRFGCGHQDQCGCPNSCNTCQPPAKATSPAPVSNVKPVSNVEQVGWFLRTTKPNTPGMDCLSCPPTGPKPKHVLPTASGLSCTGCSTWESEAVFIFGTCRQFFGEPTHRWLNGK